MFFKFSPNTRRDNQFRLKVTVEMVMTNVVFDIDKRKGGGIFMVIRGIDND